MRCTRLFVLSTCVALACAGTALRAQAPAAPHPAIPVAQTPPELQPPVQKAVRAFDEFQTSLIRRMNDELMRGGPAAAFGVYRDEAANLTATIARRDNMRIGRTSWKLRNTRNQPPAWAAAYVTEAAARAYAKSPTLVIDLGPLVGVLQPLETKDVCLMCHGPSDTMRPAIAGAIRANFPGDRATGFEVGQVRGWIWAEVPKR